MRTVLINGKAWAVGLNWHPLVQAVTVAAVLRAADTSINALSGEKPDMVCVHNSQFGFGFSGRNGKQFNGVLSLGASLNIPYRSFLGCFRFTDAEGDEFWWVFARSDGQNIGGFADAYYDNAQDADSAVRALQSLNPDKFEEIFLAEDTAAGIRYLEPFLSVSFWSRFSIESKVLPLEYFVRRKRLLFTKMGIVALIGIGGWLASSVMGSYLTDFEFSSKSQKARERIEERRQYLQGHPEELFAQEWKSVPGVEEVFVPCLDEILKSPLSISGWLFDAAECRREKTGIRVNRNYAHTPAARFVPLPSTAKIDPKLPKILKEVSTVTTPVSSVWKDMAWTSLPIEPDVTALFLQIAQLAEVKTSVKLFPREKKAIQDIGVITCPWAVGVWAIESVPSGVVYENGFVRILESVPGIVVDSIGYGQATSWKISGKVYVR